MAAFSSASMAPMPTFQVGDFLLRAFRPSAGSLAFIAAPISFEAALRRSCAACALGDRGAAGVVECDQPGQQRVGGGLVAACGAEDRRETPPGLSRIALMSCMSRFSEGRSRMNAG